jgi:glycine/D-amino acid oxidase-like deaminating enzyme
MGFGKRSLRVDVVVNGGGGMGLWMAKNLSALGFKVALLEREARFAGGPSTRNEGWLHCTYHAAAISDHNAALQVGRRSLYGYKQIRRFAPEAVEDPDVPAYALVRDTALLEQAMSRWDELGVPYRRVRAAELNRVAPHIRTDRAAAIFATQDVSLNTRLVYAKALDNARCRKAVILCNTEIIAWEDDYVATLQSQTQTWGWVEARLFVHTTGYGVEELFRTKLATSLPCRYWKAHLLDLPRVMRPGAFYLDKGEATIMHHGAWSIVGATADSLRIADPSHNAPDPTKVAELTQALRRLIDIHEAELQRIRPRACIKVDMFDELDHNGHVWPILNVLYTEPRPNHLLILPGKMTEIPYVADRVTYEIFDRLTREGAHPIALRPIDTYLSM